MIGLNIVQIITGCALVAISSYVILSVTKYLYSEKSEIRFVFTVFALFGTHVVILHLIGIHMTELCLSRSHKRSTRKTLVIWLLGTSYTICEQIILSSLIVRISKHIVRSVRHSMEKGMRHYLTDPIWKVTIDRWQFQLKCCGVEDYKDWYMMSWLDKEHVNIDDESLRSLLLSKDHLHLPVTPWSCCNTEWPMQCLHDPLQQVESAHLWKEQPSLPGDSLYQRGCLAAIRYPLETALVCFLGLIILMLFIQCAILIIARFLSTSCQSAAIMNDVDGVAPGWLFSKNCMNDKKMSIAELKQSLQVFRAEVSAQPELNSYRSADKSKRPRTPPRGSRTTMLPNAPPPPPPMKNAPQTSGSPERHDYYNHSRTDVGGRAIAPPADFYGQSGSDLISTPSANTPHTTQVWSKSNTCEKPQCPAALHIKRTQVTNRHGRLSRGVNYCTRKTCTAYNQASKCKSAEPTTPNQHRQQNYGPTNYSPKPDDWLIHSDIEDQYDRGSESDREPVSTGTEKELMLM